MKNLLIFIVICGFFTCSPSTQISKSWRDPAATFTASPDQKVLVVAMVKDESSRRTVEDNLVKRIKAPSVPSYTLIDEDMLRAAKEDNLSDVLKKDGFSHVMMVRLADIEKETAYVPGNNSGFYGAYGRFYGYGGAAYGSQGYYTTEKSYFIETAVYTVEPDKLVYSATTKTVDPSKMDKTINAVADAVTLQMQKDGFLPKPGK